MPLWVKIQSRKVNIWSFGTTLRDAGLRQDPASGYRMRALAATSSHVQPPVVAKI
jgi:hypothetical protein